MPAAWAVEGITVLLQLLRPFREVPIWVPIRLWPANFLTERGPFQREHFLPWRERLHCVGHVVPAEARPPRPGTLHIL
jgi:hypothetical protein